MVAMHAPDPAPAPQPRSHYERPTKKNTSLRNMVWALGLTMLIVVGVGIGFFGVGGDQSREVLPNSSVDIAASAQRAQDSAPFPVAVPDLGEGWSERSARYVEGQQSWEIRYSSPDRHLVTLSQAPEVSAPMLSASLPGAVVEEQREIDGVPCEVLRGGTDDEPLMGLSCSGAEWGLLVHGATDLEELEQAAQAAIASVG